MADKTIVSVVKNGLCTGCGTCIALCPRNAIKLTIDIRKGIYTPILNEEKCNNCGVCTDVCPGHEVDFETLNKEIFEKEPEDKLIGNYINCYYGYSTDNDIRYNCASGGLITQLLVSALEEGIIDGALVTRMKMDKPLEPEPFIARTREELIESSKSKYCPVPANIALKEILDKEGRYAIVGLPCHIHGAIKAEMVNNKLRRRIVLHLGIWCSTTCSFLATEFVLKKFGIDKDKIIKIDYRGEGWPGGMSIHLKDGTKKFIELGEYWDDNFASFSPHRCRLCCDANAELADISFGDFRGHNMYSNAQAGVSGIISRNDTGEAVLDRMLSKLEIEIFRINSCDVAASQGYFNSKKCINAQFRLLSLVGKKYPHYNNQLLIPPIATNLLQIVYYCPRWFFASKRYLWRLLEAYNFTYNNLLRLALYIKSKIK